MSDSASGALTTISAPDDLGAGLFAGFQRALLDGPPKRRARLQQHADLGRGAKRRGNTQKRRDNQGAM
jgi:hypothetical protein